MRAIALVALVACIHPTPAAGVSRQGLSLLDTPGPAVLASGDNSDWSSDACGAASGLCRVRGDVAGSTLTGISQSYYGDRDVGIYFLNDGPYPITLANDRTSGIHNRLHTQSGVDVVIAPGYGALFSALVDWSTDPYTPLGWRELPYNAAQTATHSTPSRVLGTAFQPSTSRMTYACYSVQIDSAITLSTGESGRAELLTDASNPPTTIRAAALSGATGTLVVGASLIVTGGGELCAVVRPLDYVLVRGVTAVGSPTFTLVRQTETTL